MNPAIQGYTAAVADSIDATGRAETASELLAVERLVATNAPLRDALTDVAVPFRARRAVLEDLLSGKVGPATRRLAGFAAGAVHAQEVPGAISWVAHRVHQIAEDQVTTDPVVGHRAGRERVGGYAAAVYEDLSADELEGVEDELFRFARTVASAPDLRTALSDRDLPPAVRRGVVDDLLTGKVHLATLRLVDYVATDGRPRDVVGTLDWLAEQTARARGWRVARVQAGQEVDDAERRKLEDTLSRVAGAPVELQVSVDPALLAGVNVEIGDLRLDATVRGRLDRLREHVLPGGWTDLGYGRVQRAVHARGAPGPGEGADGTGRDHEGPRS